MLFNKIIQNVLVNLNTKIALQFFYRSNTVRNNLEIKSLRSISYSYIMSSKKTAAKRKVNKLPESPLVKDPFSAAANSAKKFKIETKENVESIQNEPPKAKSRSPSPVVEVENVAKIATGHDKKKSKKANIEDQEESDKSETSTKYNSEEFKTASNGKEWNLKIVSWNVNGIRAWIEVI